jgi:hypothetical protein
MLKAVKNRLGRFKMRCQGNPFVSSVCVCVCVCVCVYRLINKLMEPQKLNAERLVVDCLAFLHRIPYTIRRQASYSESFRDFPQLLLATAGLILWHRLFTRDDRRSRRQSSWLEGGNGHFVAHPCHFTIILLHHLALHNISSWEGIISNPQTEEILN